jgi:NAD(P)H-dependent FMN reductase
MPKLALISGSRRVGSYNGELLDHLGSLLSSHNKIDRITSEDLTLPLFDQSLESDPTVYKKADALHARIQACDGLLIASPEYNGQITPVLKNAVDWVSRIPTMNAQKTNAFLDKPVLLTSASSGRSGGFASIPHMRALFGHVGALVLGGAICLPCVEDFYTPIGLDLPDSFNAFALSMLERFERISSARARNFI